jgi:shikimate 5-dehydrogenase
VVRARAFESPSRNVQFELEMNAALSASACVVRGEPLHSGPHDEQFSCVIQATSAGMFGADDGGAVASALAWNALRPEAIALDVVYTPSVTPFLRAAGLAKLHHRNGLGMLARQGARALEHWLGVGAPLQAMMDALG